jgi:rhodanese-related sulfurtransferase
MTYLSTLFGANAQETDTIKILNAEDFNNAIIKDNVQLVDVRSPKEFDQGSIDSAINIDYFQQDTFGKAFSKLDKTKPVYIFCRSGNRSQKSATLLEQMGFSEIYDLRGGFMSWPFKK